MPAGIDIEVADGESLMAAAERQGYRWPTVCGGQGTCQTCFVEVLGGADSCSKIGALEHEGIAALRRPTDGGIRLACQLRILGNGVTVLKRGVRPDGDKSLD
ncbi:MAG: 2Fe-2S iron-sulfur cluster-binding protein [Sciscionella sp.]